MPIAKVQLPDGRIGKFEVEEGTTPEEIEAFVAEQLSRPQQAQLQQQMPLAQQAPAQTANFQPEPGPSIPTLTAPESSIDDFDLYTDQAGKQYNVKKDSEKSKHAAELEKRGVITRIDKMMDTLSSGSPDIRKDVMSEVAKEVGPLQAFLIGAGKGFYDVGRGLGIADQPTETETQAIEALKKERPYTTGAGEIAGSSAPFLPLGAGAGAISSMPLRVLASGVAGGIEGGILSKGMGGDFGTTAKGAGLGAGVAVGAEILFPVLGKLGRKIFQRVKGRAPKGAILDAIGNPTPELEEALSSVGIGFNDLKEDAVELITGQKPGADVGQVAKGALFKQEGVPYTKGDITPTDFKQVATEQKLLESANDTAAEPLRQFRLKQSEAIKANLKSNLTETGKEETGELIHDALVGRKKLLRTQKNELYKQATENAKDIGGVPIFVDNLKEVIPDEDLFEDLAITAPGGMESLDKILTKYGVKEPSEEMIKKGFRSTPLTVENFERFRKTLNAIERGDNTGAVSVATRPIKDALDKELAEIGTSIQGQSIPDAIMKPLIEARKKVVKLKTEFSPQSIIGKIIDTKKDGVTQITEASKIYDKIVGRANPVENTRKLITSLNKSGESGKQAIASIQATTMLDLIDSGFGTESRKISGVKTFNPIAFKNRLKAIGDDKINAIFSNQPQTISKLKNIDKIAESLIPSDKAVPKGSASVILDLANKLGIASISSKVPGGHILIGSLRALADPVKKGIEVDRAIAGSIDIEPVKYMIDHQFSGIASALGIAATLTPNEKDKSNEQN